MWLVMNPGSALRKMDSLEGHGELLKASEQ